ncbi:MAG: AAA family ATPase, partial [Gallionellaceae bacterium]|nr:AAA family ATPase [Gallionellaceae bacterium]
MKTLQSRFQGRLIPFQTAVEIKKKVDEANAPLVEQVAKIRKLESSLSSAGVGAEKFNEALHRFLGRSELSLRFKPEDSGYEIIRNNTGEHDGNLSEGEKTAIAFVYFITKLTENDNKISDTIVVVDDPVS